MRVRRAGAPAAQQPASSASTPRAASAATGADADLGARIASQGVPNVAACAGCHGASGEGNAAANFPRIAGQSSRYLRHELEAYANGARTNPVMTPIAKALDDAQRRAVAAHYAALEHRRGQRCVEHRRRARAPRRTRTRREGCNRERHLECVERPRSAARPRRRRKRARAGLRELPRPRRDRAGTGLPVSRRTGRRLPPVGTGRMEERHAQDRSERADAGDRAAPRRRRRASAGRVLLGPSARHPHARATS